MSNQEFVNDLSRSYDSTGGNNGRHIMMASRSEDYRSDDDHLLNVLSTDEGDGSFNRSEFVEGLQFSATLDEEEYGVSFPEIYTSGEAIHGGDIVVEERNFRTDFLSALQDGEVGAMFNMIEHASIDTITAHSDLFVTALFRACESGALEIVKYLTEKKIIKINSTDESGRTALHYAVSNGKIKIVDYLINSGANINAQTYNGRSSLHIAVVRNDLSVINFLLSHKIDIDAYDKHRRTALHVACWKGFYDITLVLLKAGAKLDTTDKNRRGPLHFAIVGNATRIVQYLVQERKVDVQARTKNGTTALHVAYSCGHFELFKYLIQQKANINTRDKNGETVLHYASSDGNLQFVKYLIDNRAKTDLTSTKTRQTALHLAYLNGHHEVFQTLVKRGVNVNIYDLHFKTPIHWAAARGDIETIKLLFQHGANLNAKDGDGKTALHFAYLHSHMDITDFLLKNNVDVNTKDKNGRTVVHHAAIDCDIRWIDYFVKHHGSLQEKDNYGRTVLHFICQYGDIPILDHVLQQVLTSGTSSVHRSTNLEETDKDGATPLHYAVIFGKFDIVKNLLRRGANMETKTNKGHNCFQLAFLHNHLPIVDYFLREYHMDVNNLDENGKNFLHTSIEEDGHDEIVAHILHHYKVDVNLRTKEGKTGLHLSLIHNRLTIFHCLVNQRADVNAKDEKTGETALQLAIRKRLSLDIITLLLVHKADPNVKMHNGVTALHLAYEYNCEDIFELLLTYGADINAVDERGRTLLCRATEEIKFDWMDMILMHHAALEMKDACGVTAVHLAAKLPKSSTLEIYLARCPHMIGWIDEDNKTPLHYATCAGSWQAVVFLLEKGASVDAISKDGKSSLLYAASLGHEKILDTLITHKASLELRDKTGKNALLTAAACGQIMIMKALVDRQVALDVTDKEGNSPLRLAIRGYHENVIQFLLEHQGKSIVAEKNGEKAIHIAAADGNVKALEFLLSNRNFSYIEDTDKDGKTALHYASIHGRLPAVRFLIHQKAKVNGDSKEGKTALHYATMAGHIDIVDYLVEKGADIHHATRDKTTPLLCAAFQGHYELVKYFLDRKADIHEKDEDEWTALFHAASNGHASVVKYLIDHHGNAREVDVKNHTALYHACNGFRSYLATQKKKKQQEEEEKVVESESDDQEEAKEDHHLIVESTKTMEQKAAVVNEKTFLLTFRYLLEATVFSRDDYQQEGVVDCLAERILITDTLTELRLDVLSFCVTHHLLDSTHHSLDVICQGVIQSKRLPVIAYVFRYYFPSLRNPIAFWNKPIPIPTSSSLDQSVHGKEHSSSTTMRMEELLLSIIRVFLQKQDFDIVYYLLLIIHGLTAAATANHHTRKEQNELYDIRQRFLIMMNEIFTCASLNDRRYVQRILRVTNTISPATTATTPSGTATTALDGEKMTTVSITSPTALTTISTKGDLFKERSLISYCLSHHLTILFDKPQIDALIDTVFYEHRSYKIIFDRTIRNMYPYSLYAWSLHSLFYHPDDHESLFHTWKEYLHQVQYTHSLRAIPAVAMWVDFVSKTCMLWILMIVIIHEYGRTFQLNYHTADNVIDDTIFVHNVHLYAHYSGYEIALLIMAIGDFVSSIGSVTQELQDHLAQEKKPSTSLLHIVQWIGTHIMDDWNAVTFLTSLLLFLWIILRFACTHTYFSVARVLLTITAIPMATGLLRYLSVYRPIGELVLMIRGITYEVVHFATIYLIALIGFGMTFYGLFYTPHDYATVGYAFLSLLGNTLGVLSYDIFDRSNSEVVNVLSICLLIVFMIFSAIILMNFLIAYMSNSFPRIQQEAHQQWCYAHAKIVRAYLRKKDHNALCILPSPFNLLTVGIHAVEVGHYYLCCDAYKHPDTFNSLTEKASIIGTLSNVFYSVFVGTWLRLYYNLSSYLTLTYTQIPKVWKRRPTLFTGIMMLVYTLLAWSCLLLDVVVLPVSVLGYELWQYSFTSPTALIDEEHVDDTITTPLSHFYWYISFPMRMVEKETVQEDTLTVPVVMRSLSGSVKSPKEVTINTAVTLFTVAEIERIVRPLQPYIRSLATEELSRLESNLSQETHRVAEHVQAHHAESFRTLSTTLLQEIHAHKTVMMKEMHYQVTSMHASFQQQQEVQKEQLAHVTTHLHGLVTGELDALKKELKSGIIVTNETIAETNEGNMKQSIDRMEKLEEKIQRMEMMLHQLVMVLVPDTPVIQYTDMKMVHHPFMPSSIKRSAHSLTTPGSLSVSNSSVSSIALQFVEEELEEEDVVVVDLDSFQVIKEGEEETVLPVVVVVEADGVLASEQDEQLSATN